MVQALANVLGRLGSATTRLQIQSHVDSSFRDPKAPLPRQPRFVRGKDVSPPPSNYAGGLFRHPELVDKLKEVLVATPHSQRSDLVIRLLELPGLSSNDKQTIWQVSREVPNALVPIQRVFGVQEPSRNGKVPEKQDPFAGLKKKMIAFAEENFTLLKVIQSNFGDDSAEELARAVLMLPKEKSFDLKSLESRENFLRLNVEQIRNVVVVRAAIKVSEEAKSSKVINN